MRMEIFCNAAPTPNSNIHTDRDADSETYTNAKVSTPPRDRAPGITFR
jgi:hypothetical protein